MTKNEKINISKHLFNQPWTISSDGFETLIGIVDHELDIESVFSRRNKALDGTKRAVIRDGIAIVPVSGPIFRYANLFTEICGATSISTLAKDFQAAVDDPDVKAVILNIDSPGGQVNGVNEFSEIVFNARSQKPVIAYVGGMGASAAYWIASAADEIIADDTAELGSIGVVIGYRKNSDHTIEIVSTASPKKRSNPETDKGRAQILERADSLAEVFIGKVARNRDVKPSTVVEDFGQGGVLVGQKAIDAGLADRLGSLEGIIAELQNKTNSNGGYRSMTEEQKPKITVEYISTNYPQIAEHFRAEGKAAGIAEGKAAELDRIKKIMSLDMPGHEALLRELAFDGKTTAADAAIQVIHAEKEKRKKIAADTQADAAQIPDVVPDNTDMSGENLLVANAKRRAGKEA